MQDILQPKERKQKDNFFLKPNIRRAHLFEGYDAEQRMMVRSSVRRSLI